MLTDKQIRAVKAADSEKKLFDEKGLLLLVRPTGAKVWRFRYRWPNKVPKGGPKRKEKQLCFGAYPEITLKEARDHRDQARTDLRNGIDPGVRRKAEERSPSNSFEAVAVELLTLLKKSSVAGEMPTPAAGEVVERTIQLHRKRKARRREPISADTIETMERRLVLHVYPYVGAKDVAEVTSPDLLDVVRRIESRGTFELAHRVRSICSRVLRYGRATGRKCEDVAADLKGLLVSVQAENMAAITEPVPIGQLLRRIEHYHGEPVTRLALNLSPYIFPRPIELRTMEWTRLTLDGPQPMWRVPWRRMKMRDPHLVPLSRQAVAILREVQLHTGGGQWVFPQLRNPNRPMSENCVTAALRAVGYSGEEMTGHGFRALANTQLMELGWSSKWVDMQLAHQERKKVRRAYNHAKYLPQRIVMMQAWADYIDALRANTDPAMIERVGRESALAALSTFHTQESQRVEPRLLSEQP